MTYEELDRILDIKKQDDDDSEYKNRDLEIMTKHWINEQNSPELLTFQGELIADLREMIETQVQNLHSGSLDFTSRLIMLQEIERIKFVIRQYLRIRIQKIEKFTVHLLIEERYKMYKL